MFVQLHIARARCTCQALDRTSFPSLNEDLHVDLYDVLPTMLTTHQRQDRWVLSALASQSSDAINKIPHMHRSIIGCNLNQLSNTGFTD